MVLERVRCPPHFVLFVRSFHRGMNPSVNVTVIIAEAASVFNGVKQSCVIANSDLCYLFSGCF